MWEAVMEVLEEAENLTPANMVLQSHEELEGHKEADSADMVKLKTVGKEVLSARRRAQGG